MRTLKKDSAFRSGEIIDLENRLGFLHERLSAEGLSSCQIDKITNEINVISKLLRRARKCIQNEQYGWCDAYARKVWQSVAVATASINRKIRKKSRGSPGLQSRPDMKKLWKVD